ncbi:conserved hypothetical protein [Pseudomonas sp. 9AZ]|uniref:hypothetical protein n=1 Tax=Pseudomonas sp. 9AZ TaxID=2653168 RepID=UPI0012F455CC|nr:hypothetical protein [Pseudomonas sp. 9AZ]VXC14691.1 conserved hypothetical protein [Pseudomonas sp. 9AZ]
MDLTLDAARAMRDGGIDAMAALDEMLSEALKYLPESQHADVKLATGRVMGLVIEEIINRAIAAFPELNPSEQTWALVAKTKALKRAAKTDFR